ncbi:TatD family hydrolase [Sporobolomyces salmoneus]|uniref:TatD family hydrolase n=1 Tax=Sporobolomyces salmoneus TaxID=183962 RepID=UPI00317E97F4
MCNPPSTPATPPQPKNSRSSKSSKSLPPEERLILPRHEQLRGVQDVEIVDTHTHIYSTFLAYRERYPEGKHSNVRDFVQAVLCSPESNQLQSVVDVWCEAENPFDRPEWKETVQSLTDLDGLDYRYVIGCHPHDAERYTPELEEAFIKAFSHETCVGWGEIGLDYHYDNSPREIQKEVLRKQLRAFLKAGLDKALTIHTREADDDIFAILTEELPTTTRIHIHCFTDTPQLASKLLSHFPHLFIGVTGVVTFSSNLNTSQTLRDMITTQLTDRARPRFLLETDGPYMLPANMGPNSRLGMTSKQKLPFCHSGMLPWTAEFIAKVFNEAGTPTNDGEAETEGGKEEEWNTVKVLEVARQNARLVYKI